MGGMDCSTTCLKYILIALNLTTWVFGACILGVSIWLVADPTVLERLGIATSGNNQLFYASAYTMIAVGSIIFVVSFIGCCGACRDSSCLLLTYAIIMIIILVVEVVGGILAAVYHQQITAGLKENMYNGMYYNYLDDHKADAFHKSWDKLHQKEICCGVEGPADWRDSVFYNNSITPDGTVTRPVPLSCCLWQDGKVLNTSACYLEAHAFPNRGNNFLHKEGCFKSMEIWVKNNMGIIIGVAFGIAGLQVFVVIFAFCLRSKLDEMGHVTYD